MPNRFLVADPSPTVRRRLRETLEELGAEVHEAATGREALDLARRDRFDLVLADANLPELDGAETTRELRRLPGWAHTPILVLSSLSAGPTISEGRRAGVSLWMSKSITPLLLIRAVEKALRRASERRRRARANTAPLGEARESSAAARARRLIEDSVANVPALQSA